MIGYPKNFANFYLTNALYGGYSYDDAPDTHASVSYASPEDVLKVAEANNINVIHLAGGAWQQIGEKGWGQAVTLSQAKIALTKLKEKQNS